MGDKELELLKERLRWYIYDASYTEYNEQEVKYILKCLREYDQENEKEYEKLIVTLNSDHKVFETENKIVHKRSHSKIISILIVATTASILLSFFNLENAIAGLKTGFFNFLEKDDEGTTFITSPDNRKVIYYSLDDLPGNIKNTIWMPANLNEYTLEHIEVKNNVFSCDYVVAYLVNSDNSGFIEIGYTDKTLSDGIFKSSMLYDTVNIRYHIIDNDIKRKSFMLNDRTYYIKSNNLEIIDDWIYNYVDYIVG